MHIQITTDDGVVDIEMTRHTDEWKESELEICQFSVSILIRSETLWGYENLVHPLRIVTPSSSDRHFFCPLTTTGSIETYYRICLYREVPPSNRIADSAVNLRM